MLGIFLVHVILNRLTGKVCFNHHLVTRQTFYRCQLANDSLASKDFPSPLTEKRHSGRYRISVRMTAGVGNGMAYSRPHERLRVQAQGRLKASFEDDDIQRFRQICKYRKLVVYHRADSIGQQKTEPSDYPLATSINSNIPIYDASFLLRHARDSSESGRDVAMAEIHRCLLDGPGVFVIKNLVPEDRLEVVDRANETFAEIIKREKEQNGERGDHFAPAGKNDRIWNSFQKQAMLDPEGFVRYYSNEVL